MKGVEGVAKKRKESIWSQKTKEKFCPKKWTQVELNFIPKPKPTRKGYFHWGLEMPQFPYQ